MKVLIVDDEAGVRQICARALRGAGHEVVACASGDDALPLLHEHWDLVVSDVNMPGKVDGNELVRIARDSGALGVALMSGCATVSSTVAAFKDGACDYLIKPFSLDALIELVRRRERGEPDPGARPIEPRRLRQATILFADVRGFTAFSESVSPDVAATRLDALLAVFIDAVHAEGGTVNKLIGDGAMAVFGVPLPHVDPAAAAVRAALRTRDEVARVGDLRFGFGINSGAVAAGCLGSHGSSEYGVIGAVVNLASRLEQEAPGGRSSRGRTPYAPWPDDSPSACRGNSASRDSALPSRPPKFSGIKRRLSVGAKSPQPLTTNGNSGRGLLVERRLNWRCERDSNPRIMVLQTIPLDHLGIAPNEGLYRNCWGYFLASFFASTELERNIVEFEGRQSRIQKRSPQR
jgi:CheY-like chemotaxis protein